MKHPSKAFEIVFNGSPVLDRREWLYYEDIVEMFDARPEARRDLFTITYRHGPRANPSGSMLPRQKPLKVGTGMIFNCVRTGGA